MGVDSTTPFGSSFLSGILVTIEEVPEPLDLDESTWQTPKYIYIQRHCADHKSVHSSTGELDTPQLRTRHSSKTYNHSHTYNWSP